MQGMTSGAVHMAGSIEAKATATKGTMGATVQGVRRMRVRKLIVLGVGDTGLVQVPDAHLHRLAPMAHPAESIWLLATWQHGGARARVDCVRATRGQCTGHATTCGVWRVGG